MCTIKTYLLGLILFSGTVSAMVDEPIIDVAQVASDLHCTESTVVHMYQDFLESTPGLESASDKAIETQFTAYAEDHVSRTDIFETNNTFSDKK